MRKLNRPALLPEWREAMSRFLAEYPPDTHIRTETERWELFKNEQQEAYKAIRTALEQKQQGGYKRMLSKEIKEFIKDKLAIVSDDHIREQNQQGLCAFCETALSDTNRQIEHFIPKMLTSPLEEIYKRYDNQPHTELDDFKNAELSPAEGRLPIFVTLRRLFFAEYR